MPLRTHHHRLALGSVVLLSLVALAVACVEEPSAPFPADASDGGPLATPRDGGGGAEDAGPPVTFLRLAHAAPDLGPVDFCYREVGSSSFEGPVLAGTPKAVADAAVDAADAADAAPVVDAGDAGPSLAYRAVTGYAAAVATGTVEIAIVLAGSSCAESLVVGNVTLDPGKRTTIVLLGRRDVDGGAAALGLVGLVDDRTPADGGARVRVVHAALRADAAPSPILVRVVADPPRLLAERVEPRRVALPSDTVDALGYTTVLPLTEPASLAVTSLDDAGSLPWESGKTALGLAAGDVRTAFVLPDGDAFEAVICDDTRATSDDAACVVVR